MHIVKTDAGTAIFGSREQMLRLLQCDFDGTTEGATQTDPAGEQREAKPGHCGLCYDGDPTCEGHRSDPNSVGCEHGQVVAACKHPRTYWSQKERGLYCPDCKRTVQTFKALHAGEKPLR